MKKLAILSLIALMAISLAACGESPENEDSSSVLPTESNTQIANPIKEYDSLQQAETAVGFTATLPKILPDGYEQSSVSTIENSTLQIVFVNGENEICFRQSKGSEDISGDYNTYQNTQTVVVDEIEITCKGNGDTISLATCVSGEYTFAVSFLGEGIALDALTDLLQG